MSDGTFTVSLWTIAAAVVYIAFCMWLWRKSEGIPLERDERDNQRSERKRY